MIEMKYYDALGNDVTAKVEDLESKLVVANQVIESLNAKLKKPQTAKKPKPSD